MNYKFREGVSDILDSHKTDGFADKWKLLLKYFRHLSYI